MRNDLYTDKILSLFKLLERTVLEHRTTASPSPSSISSRFALGVDTSLALDIHMSGIGSHLPRLSEATEIEGIRREVAARVSAAVVRLSYRKSGRRRLRASAHRARYTSRRSPTLASLPGEKSNVCRKMRYERA